MIRVLFGARPEQWQEWAPALAAAFAEKGLAVELLAAPDGGRIDYLLYSPHGPWQDFSALPGLKAVLSLWAGVEKVVGNPTLEVPLTRMVDPGLVEGMVEYVVGHVLRYHLGMDAHLCRQAPEWRQELVPPLAHDRSVGILGLGELGRAAAEALARLHFRVTGWSRRPHDLPGIRCLSGDDGLAETLEAAEILVLLLPLTPQTENLLDAAALARLPKGARIINPGRGPLIDDAALLAALEAGKVAHATLDVFRIEPLPPDHPFWHHPRVTVTPHIAAETRPASAARVVAENLRRGEAGEPLLHLVDRRAGY
ncbi:MAG TPA: glyoxylate/hydroxypyruvate reductase A [Paracoccaceae bacterium]|nr:glyoxylate/hydroxypyruvate reductase A [Paracoccaceae bacterium]